MEKQKDKELVNRRYRWGAAAQEQLEVTGHFNDPQGTDKLHQRSNFNTGWVLLSLCLKAQTHVGPLTDFQLHFFSPSHLHRATTGL